MKKKDRKLLTSNKKTFARKGRMVLDENLIREIVSDFNTIHKDCMFSYYKSRTTNSFYIMIFYNGFCRDFRVSDHLSEKKINQFVINKNTGISNIYNIIEKNVKLLKTHTVKKLCEKVNKEMFCGVKHD